MFDNINRKDILIGYLSQFLNISSGLILIPIIVKTLTASELGLWYIFLALISFAQLLEFGLQPTITRFSSYVYSGAKELQPEGIPDVGEIVDYQLVFDLKKAASKVYQIVTLLVLLLLAVPGTWYLTTFESFDEYQLYSWVVFLFANIFNFYFTYYNGLIIGRGEQTKVNIVNTQSKLLFLLLSTILLYSGFGLLSLSIGLLVSTIYTRFRLILIYNSFDVKHDGVNVVGVDYINVLWKASYKLGITSLGGFLILKSTTFIVSTFYGLEIVAAYGLTLQLITVLYTISSTIFNLNFPKISSLQSRCNKNDLKIIVFKSIFSSLLIYLFGALFIFLFGKVILASITDNVSLLDNELLLLMLVIYFLELNHSLCAKYITTLNTVPFVNATVVSGCVIVAVNLIYTNYFNEGIFGVIFAQGAVQLLYNNWYWPYYVLKDLYFGR